MSFLKQLEFGIVGGSLCLCHGLQKLGAGIQSPETVGMSCAPCYASKSFYTAPHNTTW